MGKSKTRLHWAKQDHRGYLADNEVLQMTLEERGICAILWAFAGSQTDKYGWLVVGRDPLKVTDLINIIRRYTPPEEEETDVPTNWRRALGRKIQRVLDRVFEQGDGWHSDGGAMAGRWTGDKQAIDSKTDPSDFVPLGWYSPRMVSDWKENRSFAERGELGAATALANSLGQNKSKNKNKSTGDDAVGTSSPDDWHSEENRHARIRSRGDDPVTFQPLKKEVADEDPS